MPVRYCSLLKIDQGFLSCHSQKNFVLFSSSGGETTGLSRGGKQLCSQMVNPRNGKNKDPLKLSTAPKVILTTVQNLCRALMGRTRKKPKTLLRPGEGYGGEF